MRDSTVQELEKKKQRATKFGLPPPVDKKEEGEKRKAREMRFLANSAIAGNCAGMGGHTTRDACEENWFVHATTAIARLRALMGSGWREVNEERVCDDA